MKKLTLLLLFFSLAATAQTGVNYPAFRPELLIGKEIIIQSRDWDVNFSGYEKFYTEPDLSKRYKQNSAGYTETKALEKRHFNVTGIERKKVGTSGTEIIFIILNDPTTHETIYNWYTPGNNPDGDYYIEVAGGLTLPDDFYCDLIDVKKSEGGVQYFTEFDAGFLILKTVLPNQNPIYELVFNCPRGTYEGIIEITLKNGKIIKRTKLKGAAIQLNLTRFIYRFILTDDELKLLQESEMTNFRIDTNLKNIYNSNSAPHALTKVIPCIIKK
ncbi:MAG: hypothetical protein V4581_01195 [Bacteroidota bacterium]